jgi:hypothetical protein
MTAWTARVHEPVPDAILETHDPPARVVTLSQLRGACGPSPARGLVLGMPGLAGHPAIIGRIAAQALHDYDIWTFSVAADEPRLTGEEWFACAHAIADRILAGELAWPRALIGFSLGGLVAWLVARILAASGHAAPPVINIDGAPPHVHMAGWRDRMAVLQPFRDPDRTRMLLLCRGFPGRFQLVEEIEHEWATAGVVTETIRYRTLDHVDLVLPAAIAASGDALARFIETGRAAPKLRPERLDFATAGGESFRLLDAASPPARAAVAALVDAALPTDGSVQLGLLLLAIATGDLDMALGFAELVIAKEPGHRAATYAKIALLALLARHDAASETAAAWCRDHQADLAMEARARRSPERPGSWPSPETLILGSDESLDFALSVGRRS